MSELTRERSGIESAVGSDGVCRITIDRADAANSLSPLAREALTDAFEKADDDPSVRSVLLRATGDRHFCSGAGLGPQSAQPTAEKRPGDVALMLQKGYQRLISAVLDCDKPVVAAVKGVAAGAGASLVLACDLVVMSTEARLVEAFVHRGILPDAGAIHLLTRIVGLRKATELLMLGEPVDAATCERLTLVNRVVAPAETDAVAEELARRPGRGPYRHAGADQAPVVRVVRIGARPGIRAGGMGAGGGVVDRRPAGGLAVVRRAPTAELPGPLTVTRSWDRHGW
ncbi:enoyl-CoA hydratase/isomerase family protein [Mycolicibacterium novocastrense]|nr:enoyl-CoA hydratase/isomerase family protein [Mycolicibacterium novocastrense]